MPGRYKIITDLAVLRFNDDTKRMEVESLHPGITFEHVQPTPASPWARPNPSTPPTRANLTNWPSCEIRSIRTATSSDDK